MPELVLELVDLRPEIFSGLDRQGAIGFEFNAELLRYRINGDLSDIDFVLLDKAA